VAHEEVLSEVFSAVQHPIAAADIVQAMKTAKLGIGAVTHLLALAPEESIAEHAWAHDAYLDPRTPGGYPFGARVVKRYYEELVKRLEGSPDADGIVIGTYPDALAPLASLDRTNAHARVAVFFGHGIDRASFGEGSVRVEDDTGQPVAGTVAGFRGDEWLNVVTFDPAADWQPERTYSIVVSKSLVTLDGNSPSQDLVIPFTTPCDGCEPALGFEGRPPSPCPVTDARYPFATDEPVGGAGGAGGAAGEGGTGGAASSAGGCGVGGSSASDAGLVLLSLVALRRLGRFGRARRRPVTARPRGA